MFDSWVLSILLYVFMYMTYKLHLGRVLSVGGSKLECWGKRVLKFEVFFFWTDECSLKRTPSEPHANAPSSFLDAARLNEPWANTNVGSVKGSLERAPSEHAQNAIETWSLKRTSLRLSEPCPVQPYLIFRFVYLRTNPNFLNGFLWLI